MGTLVSPGTAPQSAKKKQRLRNREQGMMKQILSWFLIISFSLSLVEAPFFLTHAAKDPEALHGWFCGMELCHCASHDVPMSQTHGPHLGNDHGHSRHATQIKEDILHFSAASHGAHRTSSEDARSKEQAQASPFSFLVSNQETVLLSQPTSHVTLLLDIRLDRPPQALFLLPV
jgi:hypothetical protein